ncbi:MAG: YdcF family protein [Hyphomicrobium sp.]|uniref:YdcF family protein n=1 Tax=Hyphomicrobium sp. TaxID=82 RepID=UPI003D0FD0E7
MPYALSKILGLMAQPSSVAVLALLGGLVMMRHGAASRRARSLAWAGVLVLLAGGFTPLGNFLVLPLEERFAGVPAPAPGERVDGIILLGGFEDGWVSAGRGGLGLNEAAERVTEGLRFALRHPQAKVVFTGGVGGLMARNVEATGPVADFLAEAGVARERVILEGRSRNTYENALFTRDLVRPAAGERWYLVTSASHMPRAVGLFRKAGFDVIAYPVDYRMRGAEDLLRFFERIPQGLQRLDLGVNEWLGLIASRVLGRTDTLFPAP